MMHNIVAWLFAHGVSATGVGAAIAFVFSVFQFLSVRKRESREREFDRYHLLVERLVSPGEKGGMFLDRQIAVVFEPRHFPRLRVHRKNLVGVTTGLDPREGHRETHSGNWLNAHVRKRTQKSSTGAMLTTRKRCAMNVRCFPGQGHERTPIAAIMRPARICGVQKRGGAPSPHELCFHTSRVSAA
jgi:hypothetical protein